MGGERFTTTRWSLVLAAGGLTPEAHAALEQLCAIYWPPLYLFVRDDARGRSADEAADLTQEFFTQLLARQDITQVDRARGRFRDWLLQSMRHFLANQHDRRTALKRGAGQRQLSLDTELADRLYGVGLEVRLHTYELAYLAGGCTRALAAALADVIDAESLAVDPAGPIVGVLRRRRTRTGSRTRSPGTPPTRRWGPAGDAGQTPARKRASYATRSRRAGWSSTRRPRDTRACGPRC